MGTPPLRINVEVNAGDIEKLSAAAQQVAASISSMSEQFLKGDMSAKEIAASVADAASKLIAATPAVEAQSTGYLNLKAALASTTAELKETSAMIVAAGGEAGAGASILKQYSIETAQVAILQKALA